MLSCLLEHFTDKGGCGRLSVGAGYRNNRQTRLPAGPFEFSHYLYSPIPRLFKRFDIQRNAGTDDYSVRIEKIFEPVRSKT
jgi:hypothetical protein